MGASGWVYFVPYQADIEKALQELREAVFQRGEYHKVEPYWQDMTFEEFLPPDPALDDADRAEYMAAFRRLQTLPEPTSIETLLEWNAAEGTHSIIDIESVSAVPRPGAAAPLSKQQLETFFDTDRPSRSMIERSISELWDFLQQDLGRYRGEATYIIVYTDDRPDEIFFIGYSGD